MEMQEAIEATLYHSSSTNSCCERRVAEAKEKKKIFQHLSELHPDVHTHIITFYEDLLSSNLLERCFVGHTQNPNQSFNYTVWHLAPKHLNCDIKIVYIAALLAVGIYNEGNLQRTQELDLVICQRTRARCSRTSV